MIGCIIVRLATGNAESIYLAVGTCVALLYLDLVFRDWALSAMSIQIRAFYALLLVASLLPGMSWILFVQLIGTSARVLTGYCLLERELRLAAWNRIEPLSLREARQILLSLPRCGGILRLGGGGAAISPCASAIGLSPSSAARSC